LSKLISTHSFSCTECSFSFVEYFGIPVKLADGSAGLADQKFCDQCDRVTESQYSKPETVDPGLYCNIAGNTGRILFYLYDHGPLQFSNWPKGLNIPSPKKMPNVCKPLLDQELVEFTDSEVYLTKGGTERMQQFLSKPPCGICGKPYNKELCFKQHDNNRIVVRGSCPVCKKGSLQFISMGCVCSENM